MVWHKIGEGGEKNSIEYAIQMLTCDGKDSISYATNMPTQYIARVYEKVCEKLRIRGWEEGDYFGELGTRLCKVPGVAEILEQPSDNFCKQGPCRLYECMYMKIFFLIVNFGAQLDNMCVEYKKMSDNEVYAYVDKWGFPKSVLL